MKYVAYRIYTRGLVPDLWLNCKNSLVSVASMSARVRASNVEVLGFNKAFHIVFIWLLACKKCIDILIHWFWKLSMDSEPVSYGLLTKFL
jgi:hypothetical protein